MRNIVATSVVASLVLSCVAAPASAQIYWQSPDFTGAPLTPGEPGIGVMLPGATVAEERANWVWQMRSALDVARLQCKFGPTLLTSDNYDGLLRNHAAELSAAYTTLRGYFTRVNSKASGKKGAKPVANVKAAQKALDSYGDKTYNGYSTVGSQFGFCQTAARIGKSAQFATPGSLTLFTVERLRELRNSLQPAGEQYFRMTPIRLDTAMPQFDKKCWDGRGRYRAKCGTVYL